jgi:hypothetical protein
VKRHLICKAVRVWGIAVRVWGIAVRVWGIAVRVAAVAARATATTVRVLAPLCAATAAAGAATAAAGAALPSAAWAGSVRGTVTVVGQGSLTIQTPGRPVGVVNALAAAATRITHQDYPYVYGGGHAQAGIASVGIKGPGYNGKRIGYDCSGSVAAVLSAGGLWPSGAGVPSDAGIISELSAQRLIAPGGGTGPVEVTLYDDPGVHIFMNIDGRFFGTSDGGGGGDRKGGAGWLDDGAYDAYRRRYKRYHVITSALRESTDAAHSVTFDAGALQDLLATLQAGEKIDVTYRQTRAGTLVAKAVAFPGAVTATGIVGSIAADGSSLTIQSATGAGVTIQTDGLAQLLQGVIVGDTVQVVYVKAGSMLALRSVTVTTPASAPTRAL